jgi:hypothetical protein
VTPEQTAAAAYLTRTGNDDLLPMLGLAPAPPRRPRPPPVIGRGVGRCMCAPRGRRYRLCPVHGEDAYRHPDHRERTR